MSKPFSEQLTTTDPADLVRDRLLTSNPSAPDGILAQGLADYYVANGSPFRFSIFVNNRKTPSPLAFTSRHKNCIIFKANDEEYARAWIVEAALAGHSVMRCLGSRCPSFGQGTLTQICERLRGAP